MTLNQLMIRVGDDDKNTITPVWKQSIQSRYRNPHKARINILILLYPCAYTVRTNMSF